MRAILRLSAYTQKTRAFLRKRVFETAGEDPGPKRSNVWIYLRGQRVYDRVPRVLEVVVALQRDFRPGLPTYSDMVLLNFAQHRSLDGDTCAGAHQTARRSFAALSIVTHASIRVSPTLKSILSF